MKEPPLARNALLLALAYVGFISLGLPDTVTGVAWPSVRDHFRIEQGGLGLVFLGLGVGYCASSFFGGALTQALGVGALLALSSLLVAVAMFGMALAPLWPIFAACGIVWGLGSGAIDAGLNAFVAARFSARHVNWLHSFYSLGATLGPLLMTAMLLAANSWRLGYALVGAVLLGMACAFLLTRRRWGQPASQAPGASVQQASIKEALRHPLVRWQALVFFLYCGLEFTVGQWSFTLLTESRGVGVGLAGTLAGAYFGAIGVGRLLSGAFASRLGLDRMVRLATVTALAGAALFAVASPREVGVAGLLLVGLGLAPIFPCLMARTPERLGEQHAAHAVGFQVSAGMLGAAVVPGLAGLLAQALDMEAVAVFATALAALMLLAHETLLHRARH